MAPRQEGRGRPMAAGAHATADRSPKPRELRHRKGRETPVSVRSPWARQSFRSYKYVVLGISIEVLILRASRLTASLN